jgi:hypothetical protein
MGDKDYVLPYTELDSDPNPTGLLSVTASGPTVVLYTFSCSSLLMTFCLLYSRNVTGVDFAKRTQ